MVTMQEQSDAVVRTVGLTKVFRDFWLREKVTAVSELDLEILPREVFGLLGPNGSGKSTTIKMVLSLLFPTRGRVSVFGRRPSDVAIKSRIGFLPEETYLYPFLDARETLDYYGQLFHLPRRQRQGRIDMLLDMVGLAPVAFRRVAEYSKGMQRRLGLAQALINDPDLLILDEPTSGMDPLGTRQFKDLIQTLARRGKTVILSSHLLADVEDVCDRVCILYGGRRRALGSVDELLTRHGSTQIVAEQLDPDTLQRVCDTVEASGREVLEVTSPRDKLESLFLRIVEEARRQRVATGGVVSGGEVAEFLRKDVEEGREVVEQLVRASEAAPAEQPEAPPVEPPPPRADESVVEDLVSDAGPEAPEPPPPPSGAQREPGRPSPPSETDRSIIDDLVRDAGAEAGRGEHGEPEDREES